MNSADQEHERKETIHLIEHIPGHQPREDDPYYKFFHATHKRMSQEGRLVCAMKSSRCAGGIELHHYVIEYSQVNSTDLAKFKAKYPHVKVETYEDFYQWCESEENMMPLCKCHHTGKLGIHEVPYPLWQMEAIEKDGLEPAAEVVHS
jgi:hypothetical protein